MRRIGSRREVLLVEIERHCRGAGCRARAHIGLTKAEARLYDGWTCERCEQHWDDALSERDVPPEWWEELVLTTLQSARRKTVDGEPGEVVMRLSEAWRRGRSDDSESTGRGDATRTDASRVIADTGETRKTGGRDGDGS